MGRIIQKKKLRSGLPKAKAKKNGMKKNGRKKVNVLGNAIIAENWDRNLTLTQNYKRLGLVHKLNAPSGGSEKRPAKNGDGIEDLTPQDSLHINGSASNAQKKFKVGETRVERDPETGKILRVIRDEDDDIEVAGRKLKRNNPLNDPLNDLSDDEEPQTQQQKQSAIVQQLELQADRESDKVMLKKPRHQSKREEEWITRLVEKHGDNTAAMARDRKLNPMQQSEGDIKRRIRKFQKTQN